MPNTLITANSIFYGTSGRELFSGLSVHVKSGENVEICGPNGSGKTTLLRILAGLHNPDEGQVLRQTNKLGYVGHRLGITRLLTVRENIRWSTAMHKADVTEDKIREVLDRFSILESADTLVRDLSAGQSKRTALAVLMLSNHQVWLLDEPSASLDKAGEELLDQVISQHCHAGGAAVVATHSSVTMQSDQRIQLGTT